MHLNREYVRKGSIDAKQLFTKEDITEEVKKASKDIGKRISAMLRVIDSPKRPCFTIGSGCSYPYSCPLIDKCWDFLPLHNVFDLYGKGKRVTELFEKKIFSIKDVPDDVKLTAKQSIQREEILLNTLLEEQRRQQLE